jgi:hypothetical protein
VIFKAVVMLRHTNRESTVIEVRGPNASHVAAVANSIRAKYCTTEDYDSSWARGIEEQKSWYEFMRDFFHLKRRN